MTNDTTMRSLAAVRADLDRLDTPQQRANFLYDLTRAVYDCVKFNGEGGEGLDGRDSAERRSLGHVTDQALTHQMAAYNDWLTPEGSRI